MLKGIVHTQKIFFKYVMLRTVTKNSTIIIMKHTRYHGYREIIQITEGGKEKTEMTSHRRSLD